MNKKPKMGRRTLTFCCCMLAIPTCTELGLIPGLHADSMQTAMLAGALLGLCYLLIRPIMRLLTMPIGCLTLGLFTFIIDAALIMALPYVIPGFVLDGFSAALLAALLVDGLCMLAGGIK